jgi:hypothetical protein
VIGTTNRSPAPLPANANFEAMQSYPTAYAPVCDVTTPAQVEGVLCPFGQAEEVFRRSPVGSRSRLKRESLVTSVTRCPALC